jgi:PRTRC genetic system ParB family protein
MNATTTHNGADQTTSIPLSLIDKLPWGSGRKKRNKESFTELCESIKQKGVIQSVLLRPVGDRFELVAGNGRYDAAAMAGLSEIPALIRTMTDAEAHELQLEENLKRENFSLVDECHNVQELTTFYSGDRDAVAARLAWPVKKVNERLELLRCTDEVLTALENGSITIGHALVLAPFSEKLQTNTLAKVISEKWNVSYLKERAGKAQTAIKTAKFDTTDCNGCPHNSAAQSGLWGCEEQDGACSNLQCFRTKSAEWVEARKLELADIYGTVLLLNEVNESDRNSITPDVVGDEQFSTGCLGCEKRVVLVDDRVGRTLGTTVENQCIDAACYARCLKANTPEIITEPAEAEATSTDTETKTTPKTASVKKAAATDTKKAEVKVQTPTKVVDRFKADLRQIAVKRLAKEPTFNYAMMLASLLRAQTGYKSELFGLAQSFGDVVAKGCQLTPAQLKQEMESVIHHMMAVNDDSGSINFTNIMLKGLSAQDDGKELARVGWTPTEESLKEYTVSGLIALCHEAKLDAFLDAKVAGAFAKLSKQSKGDFIKCILAAEFDWKDFAPAEYLKLV